MASISNEVHRKCSSICFSRAARQPLELQAIIKLKLQIELSAKAVSVETSSLAAGQGARCLNQHSNM